MAQTGSDVSGFQSDIQKLLLEARHRWLRPAEICEILQNHQKFHIDSEPPDRPPSGSIFLFDRKVLRYFRKDGHNWRKKKDGKTVREAHEKLKVGSVDMLHCYYAHGEGNETFQRRSYWMLEQDFTHIVFVHYLEVKGNKANISGVIDTQKVVTNSQDDSPSSFSCPSKHSNATSAYTDSTSPTSTLTTSTLTSACEDAEYEDNHQASSRFHSFLEGPLAKDSRVDKIDTDLSSSYYLHLCSDFILEQGHGILEGEGVNKQEPWRSLPVQASWQFPFEDRSLDLHTQTLNQNLSFDSNAETGYMMESNSDNDMSTVGTGNYPFIVKQPLLDGSKMEEGLKKVDSFSRWIAKELGEEELYMQSTNGIPWSFIESVDAADDSTIPTQLQLDTDSLDPSISQDQLFSIIDFSPNWTYSNLATKVLITGTFLKSEQDVTKCKWSCMFGEVEVPAEVVADGVLCCHAPPHSAGQVPFYVTCSNRLACSEVREFEFRVGSTQDIDVTESSTTEMILRIRLERLLSLGSVGTSSCFNGSVEERDNIVSKIIALMEEEGNYPMEKLMPEDDFLQPRLLKEKLCSWLLYKVTEDGKGPSVMDDEGQGVLHLAAALGYNWALRPTIDSGVSIDFRDVNGWTALHWAAFCGREETVAALVSLSAAPGALTDPSPEFPLGRTPADLASGNGHKGISGYLAESSLTKYLSSLAMNDPNENSVSENYGVNTVQTVTERSATPITDGEVADVLSLKDSLAAVCNATHAAGRIHQIFRMQSFERKQFIERENDEFGSLSLVAAKTSRLGKNNGTHSAAICIQKKFRGWKKRKEFLIIRQRIVRIQAHVRGHQVRKKYRGITWSVGILEKVILRWRRKGSGLRGFRPDAGVKSPNSQEDDYDFLKEGRKQNEQRLQKALARVKSMNQYPEGRAQYRRLLTVTEGFRETNTDACNMVLNSSENTIAYGEDDLFDVETLLDDDSFMSIAFE